ncbi:MAG TPA: hypothetical protein VM840_06640, partial [Actinomycetota bacterium]|nr:hypothetical protein [Actinomycetota bacterium]
MRPWVAAVVGVLALCASAPVTAATPTPAEVAIRNSRYEPADLRVERGGIVRFSAFESSHTATATDRSFDLPGGRTFDIGESAEWKAPDADLVVNYRCSIHSFMRGRIVVGDP